MGRSLATIRLLSGAPFHVVLLTHRRPGPFPSSYSLLIVIGSEFGRGCRLGERLDFDLWLTHIGRSSMRLALSGKVAEKERLRGARTLCTVSRENWKSVPISPDLRARMEAFAAPAGDK